MISSCHIMSVRRYFEVRRLFLIISIVAGIISLKNFSRTQGPAASSEYRKKPASPSSPLTSNFSCPDPRFATLNTKNCSQSTTFQQFSSTLSDPDLLWKDIRSNLHPDHVKCGLFKCFVPSMSHKSFGYLISNRRMVPAEYAYQKALEWGRRYGICHIYAECVPPPQAVTADTIASALNQAVQEQSALLNEKDRRFAPRPFSNHLVVQVVVIIPKGSLLIHPRWMSKSKKDDQEPNLIDIDALRDFSVEMDPFDFVTHLHQSHQAFLSFASEEPSIWHDFQVFVTPAGDIVHLDLDRTWAEGPLSQPEMDHFERALARNVKVIQHYVVARTYGHGNHTSNR